MNNYLQNKTKGTYFLHLFVIFLMVSLLFSNNANAKAVNNELIQTQIETQKITIICKDKSIEEIMNLIGEKTNLEYGFSQDVKIDKTIKYSLNLKDGTVKEALNILFKNSPYTYKVESGRILIINKSAVPQGQVKRVVVKGKVIGEDRKPIAGVTILVTGTSTGAISDQNGLFSFPATVGQEIEFSYVGMMTVTQKVKDSNEEIVVAMERSAMAVEDVVVNGIFTRKAESFTGSAVTVTAKDLKRVGNQNIFQSLKNLDPSLYIMDNLEMGSDPNTLPEMKMRGTSTLPRTDDLSIKSEYQNKPNQPLFILDGFEVSASKIFDLDMNLVESVTILKDASAKALYGSKAANGVVVVETLRLVGTDTRINYTGSVDVTMPDLSSYNLCNSLEKLQFERNENEYDFNKSEDLRRYNERLKMAQDGLSTYWPSKPLRTGIGTKHSLSIEMNKNELKTMLSINYGDVKGVMKGSDRQNFQGTANVSYRYKNIVLFKNNMSFSSNSSSDSPYGSFSTFTTMNPYERVYDEFGNLASHSSGSINPIIDGTLNTKLANSYKEFINNTYAEFTIIDGLKLTGRFGITSKQSDADRFYPANHSMFFTYTEEEQARKGSYSVSNGKSTAISGDVYANYSKSFGKHYLFANVGFNIAETKYRDVQHTAEGFPSDKMEDIMFALQYKVDSRPGGVGSIKRDIGLLAVVSYAYDDRYLSDFTIRTSAASMFGENNKWGNFWSAGLGWNLHKEKFMKDVEAISLFKLRGSIGSTGNQNFDSNSSLAVYNYIMDKRYNGQLGSTLNNMYNPDLKWEHKMDYNAGLDATIWGVSIRFDWYNTITENMVTNIALAPSSGFSVISDNLGKVKNSGFELYLAKTILSSENGFLTVSASATTNKNKIVAISEAMKNYNDNQRAEAAKEDHAMPVALYVDGMDMNAIWAVPSCGIDPATGLELFKGKDGYPTYLWKNTDLAVMGSTEPKFRGNFGFNGEYKGIGLSFTCTFLAGGEMYNSTLVSKIENINTKGNVDKRALTERWSHIDQKAYFRIPHAQTPYTPTGIYYMAGCPSGQTQATSRFIQKRNELNLSSISVYYDVNRRFVKKLGLERLKFSAYMNDIAQFSSIGVERGTSYPFARTISFSLSGTF